MKDKRIAFGSEIKSLGNGRFELFIIRFTDATRRDLYKEYFTDETSFNLKAFPIKGRPILIDHAMHEGIGAHELGLFETQEIIEGNGGGIFTSGRNAFYDNYVRYLEELKGKKSFLEELPNPEKWVQEQDEKAQQYQEIIDRWIREGKMAGSSGALPQTVRVREDDGFIEQWNPIEGSLTRTAAMPLDTQASYKLYTLNDLHNDLLRELDAIEAPVTTQDKKQSNHSKQSKGATKMDELLQKIMEMISTYMDEMKADMPDEEDPERMSDEEYKMDEEEQKAIAAEVAKSFKSQIEKALSIATNGAQPSDEQVARAVKSYADEMFAATAERYFEEIEARKARRAKIVAEARAKAQRNAPGIPKSDAVGGHRGNGNGNGTIESIRDVTPFDNWTPADFSFAMDISRKNMPNQPRIMPSHLINQAFMKQFADRAEKAHRNGEVRLSPDGIKAINAIKANELDYTTQTGFGEEWVFTSWSEQIWDKPRLDLVYTNFNVTEMPSNPYEMPAESTDPTVYYVTETADEDQLGRNDANAAIPDSKIATNKIQLNAKKHALRVNWSAELDEDAIGTYLPKFRAQSQRAVEDAIEKSVLLGDTSTSGNINLDGATPGATASYMAYDGIVHQALVTATTNAVDASGNSPTLAHIRQIRSLLGNAQGYNPANLGIFTDFPTYMKLLSIDAILTVDKIGNQATILSGSMGQIDGINVFVSGQMALADSDGKITSGGNVVNRGRLAMVYMPDWYVGYRRRIASSLEYLAFADAWELVLTVRTALSARSYSSAGAQQSSDDSVALLYNIGV